LNYRSFRPGAGRFELPSPTNLAMFAKLLLIILCAGAIACCLLAIRQERIEAAHEMWRIHHRLVDRQHMLWDLRQQIFSSSRPDEVRRMLAAIGGQWTAIPVALNAGAQFPRTPALPLHQLAAGKPLEEFLSHRDG
jgi:hypothetical protein